jgi:hypothetical protein
MVAPAVSGFEPDPNAPDFGTLMFADGRALPGVHKDVAASYMTDPMAGATADASGPSNAAAPPNAGAAGGAAPVQAATVFDAQTPGAIPTTEPGLGIVAKPPTRQGVTAVEPVGAEGAATSRQNIPAAPVPGQVAVDENGLPHVYHGASAGGPVVTGGESKRETEGAAPTQAQMETRRDLAIDRRLLNQAQVSRDVSALDEQAAGAQEAAEASRQRVQAAQIQRDGIKNQFLQDRDAARQDVAQATSGQVDPNHWFGSKAPFEKIVVGLGQIFSAFTSAYTNRPNIAFEMMQKEREQDIAAQRDALDRKGAAANNRLSQLVYDYKMDRDDAEQQLKHEQDSLISQVTTQMAAATKKKDVIDAANKFDLDIQQQQLEQDQKDADKATGKRTYVERFQQRQAQGAGWGAPNVALAAQLAGIEHTKAQTAALNAKTAASKPTKGADEEANLVSIGRDLQGVGESNDTPSGTGMAGRAIVGKTAGAETAANRKLVDRVTLASLESDRARARYRAASSSEKEGIRESVFGVANPTGVQLTEAHRNNVQRFKAKAASGAATSAPADSGADVEGGAE